MTRSTQSGVEIVEADEVPWDPRRVAPTTMPEMGRDLDVGTAMALVEGFCECPVCDSDLQLEYRSAIGVAAPRGRAEDRDVAFGSEYASTNVSVHCSECETELAGLVEEAANPTIRSEPEEQLAQIGCVFVELQDYRGRTGTATPHTAYLCVQVSAIRVWKA